MLHARHHAVIESMSTFVLHLQSATQYERIEDVVSFVGVDDSGSFGILGGHARFITPLTFGLARFRATDPIWHYLALPSALLYFVDNQLYLNSRRYLRDTDYKRIRSALEEQLLMEEENLRGMKESLHRLEEGMFKRLLQTKGGGELFP
jgi:F-type H+-transporting ATPase subunit epsilon